LRIACATRQRGQIANSSRHPFLGAGEAAQGPAAAALANALADATGVRIRDLPLSPNRLQAALRDGAI